MTLNTLLMCFFPVDIHSYHYTGYEVPLQLALSLWLLHKLWQASKSARQQHQASGPKAAQEITVQATRVVILISPETALNKLANMNHDKVSKKRCT